jgi:hypothetical protein
MKLKMLFLTTMLSSTLFGAAVDVDSSHTTTLPTNTALRPSEIEVSYNRLLLVADGFQSVGNYDTVQEITVKDQAYDVWLEAIPGVRALDVLSALKPYTKGRGYNTFPFVKATWNPEALNYQIVNTIWNPETASNVVRSVINFKPQDK